MIHEKKSAMEGRCDVEDEDEDEDESRKGKEKKKKVVEQKRALSFSLSHDRIILMVEI